MKGIVILLLFLFLFSASFTQQKWLDKSIYNNSGGYDNSSLLSSINFYSLTNTEGLSQSTANVLLKDSEGFLWIGTDDGLNRFDGKEFKRFYYRFNDSATIAANEIYGICEDPQGRIWVAHFNGGLSCYDKNTRKFTRFSSAANNKRNLSSNRMYGIYCASNGNLWARSVKGISKINPVDLSVINYDHPSLEDPNTANVDIEETAHHIWFGGKLKGLLRINKNGSIDPFRGWNTKIHGKAVFGICKNNKELLVTSEKGLFRVFEAGNNNYKVEGIIKDSVAFAGASKLLRLNESNLIWIATELQGILVADIAQRKIVRQIHSAFIKDNLLSNSVYDLLQDDEKNIFVATGRGLNVYSPYSRIFNNYENIFRKIPDFGHPVYAIHELENGHLLLGTRHGGAWYFKPQTLEIKPIAFTKQTSEQNNIIYYFTPFIDKSFLVSTSRGIHCLKLVNGGAVIQPLQHFWELTVLDTVTITEIIIQNDSLAWISSFTNGFFKWNYKKHTLKQYTKNEDYPSNGPVDNQVLDLSFTAEQNITLCTKNGFSIFYPGADTFQNMSPGKNYPFDLPARNIKNAYDDGRYIWISTYGAGVQKFDKKKRSFTALTSSNGLPNDAVYAVVPDGQGRLWISTNNGLAAFDIKTENITVYTTEDGLPDNEFNARAAFQSHTGNIFYSTINGLVSIGPSLTAVNPYNPQITLTYAVANNGERDTVVNTYRKTTFTFPAGFNYVTFKFAALSFAAPAKNQYKVKLEDFDKEWTLLQNENEFRYPNLPPGTYTLVVMGSNNSGKWSDKTLSVKVTILPFWYQTWWFKLLLALLAAAALYAAYQYRINQIVREEKLRRKISGDLHDDIGSTLSSINIYAELAKNNNDNKGYIDIIQQHTRSTINNLDDLVWSINPNNDNLDVLTERMRSFAQPLLSDNYIVTDFKIQIEEAGIAVAVDKRRSFYFAFKEMVANVVKHAGCTFCAIRIEQKGAHFSIEVKDNGKGFRMESVNNQRNGLHNLRRRALENGGAFKIVSAPGKGVVCTFTVLLK